MTRPCRTRRRRAGSCRARRPHAAPVELRRLRARRIEPEAAVRAASLAGALADPTRLSLAATLLEAKELCVCDLSWIVERPQALVSHHARLLRERGLLRSRRDGKMVLYELTETWFQPIVRLAYGPRVVPLAGNDK